MADSITQPSVELIVKVGADLDSLVEEKYLYPVSAQIRTAPVMPSASFFYNYGVILRPDSSILDKYPPIDLSEKYVQIVPIAPGGGELDPLFTGFVPNTTDAIDGEITTSQHTASTGTQTFQAYGLEFLLSRITINESIILNGDDEVKIPTDLCFNGSNELLANASAAEGEGGSKLFSLEDEAELWTGSDIVKYLLGNFNPEDSGVPDFTLSGPDVITPMQIDPSGKTILEILNEIYRPSRGFTYVVGIVAGFPEIQVRSMADEDIELGGEVIVPRNDNVWSLTPQVEFSRDIDLLITKNTGSSYSKIRVESEPIRIMATLDLHPNEEVNGFKEDWPAQLKLDYDAAETPARQDDKYNILWQRFILPKDYSGLDYDLNPIIPKLDAATGEITYVDTGSGGIFFPSLHTIDRTIPIMQDADDVELLANYRKPILFFDDAAGNRVIADKADRRIGFKSLDNTCGIQLRARYPHQCAGGEFLGDRKRPVDYDYKTGVVTVSFYSDTVLAYELPGDTSILPKRTKVLRIPNYHYWVAPQTHEGAAGENEFRSAEVYRDDYEDLKKLTAAASAWYGRIRNQVSYKNHGALEHQEKLGGLVTDVEYAGSTTPVNTIVTAIDYEFSPNQSTSIKTDAGNIALDKTLGKQKEVSTRNMARRVSAVEQRTRNLPIRELEQDVDSHNPFKIAYVEVPTEVPGVFEKKISIEWGNITLGSEVSTRWPFPFWEDGKEQAENFGYYPETGNVEPAGELWLVVTWDNQYVDVNGYKTNCEIEIVRSVDSTDSPDKDYGLEVFWLGYWSTDAGVIKVVPIRSIDIESPWG